MYRHTAGIEKDEDNDIRRIKHYLHTNFGKSYSFEFLCQSLPLSHSYLRAKFKQHTGMTVTEYRNYLRINRAKEMIESGHFTMKKITKELGYCDAYHFSKAFKNSTGFSPRAYMKQNK